MKKIIILINCFVSTLLCAQNSGISIDTISNYNSWGWKAIVIQNDFITFAVMPAIGGRVMQYDLSDHPSIYVNPAEIGKTYMPSQFGSWHNFGGYKTWPAPQSRWPGTWPPPSTLDCGNYTFQIDSLSDDSVAVLVVSPIEQWVAPGIQFERKATAYPGTSRIKMEQTIINQGTQAVSWSMWSITQSIVNHSGQNDYENFWVYFPINPNSVYGSSGVSPQGSSIAWKGEVASGVYGVQFNPDNTLIYADPHKGWIAYTDLLDSVVYVKTFNIFEGAHYPDSARVTVYVSSTNPLYLEVEVKSPIVNLDASGGSYTFTENWWAAKVRAPVLDVNSVGVIASRLSYVPATQNLSAIYGVFHQGTARVVFIDAEGQIVTEGMPHTVSPFEEFQLQDILAIPDSAKRVEVRVYNPGDELIGVLDSTEVSQLLTTVGGKNPVIIQGFHLSQNHPNPFNPSTTITYELPKKSSVKVIIYDLQGREIKSFKFNEQSAGYQKVVWDGTNNQGYLLSSGIYIFRVRATSLEDGRIFDQSVKMTLLK
jgi:hypothetical protein